MSAYYREDPPQVASPSRCYKPVSAQVTAAVLLAAAVVLAACGNGSTSDRGQGTQERPEAPAATTESLGVRISRADLYEGADLARQISLSLLPLDAFPLFYSQEYDSREDWNDWEADPQDRELSQFLAEEGYGPEQEIRQVLFDSGYLRRLNFGLVNRIKGKCLLLDPWHSLILTVMVFETPTGARAFYDQVVHPYVAADSGKFLDVVYGARSKTGETKKCPDYSNGEYFEQIETRSTDFGWLSSGPFVISVTNRWIIWNPDLAYLDYALDQDLRLREKLPMYYSPQ